MKPEESARQTIDAMLADAGWLVQDVRALNLYAGRGVAVRELQLGGYGSADYGLYVDGRAVGVIEAKKEGTVLSGIEVQAEKYAVGVAEAGLAPHPVPFRYLSTGVETRFANHLDPEPRSRDVFSFHRPETLAEWLAAPPVDASFAGGRPSTLRSRLRTLPPLVAPDLWPAQRQAVRNLEASLALDRPRALIQMATGSGKTFTAITSIYRLVKHAGARRVLFLVDRSNLGRQALKEFQQYATPDDGRKFTELYNAQRLTTNKVEKVSSVVVTTIQRMFSMLRGDTDLDPELEEGSLFASGGGLVKDPVEVAYNPALPPEFFDFVFVDECHRSIYSLWRQVLEYFDAYLIGLTATPAKQTFAFFHQNLVMEYGHDKAVADGVNVDFDVYRIRTKITEQGATVEAGAVETIGKRDRASRRLRWERLDEDLTYAASDLDRDVVSRDQIRTVVQTYRDRLFTEIFPGRVNVPKTLIYAKDDNHADDIVQIVREEFGKGDAFCEKITYRTATARIVAEDGTITYKASGVKPEDLLSSFRNSFNPRIVVTVDMIATGTDIKPLEVVMFLRAVKSRNFFEQMKGRGVRVLSPTELQEATPDATSKERFVLVDCVGLVEADMIESPPVERRKTVALDRLLQLVSFGSTDEDVLSSLAGRLARIEKRIGTAERKELADLAGGTALTSIVAGLFSALDADTQVDEARRRNGLPPDAEPSTAQLDAAATALLSEAARPIVANPALRARLVTVQRSLDQVIDEVSRDEVLEAGFSTDAKEKARALVTSFEAFLTEHRDEITALQLLYSRPFRRRPTQLELSELAEALKAPPRMWTPERLWHAYEALERDRVRGAGVRRLLTDLVSLVRFGLHQESQLVPYPETVNQRFARWLTEHESRGEAFTPEQRQWLESIRDHIAANLAIEVEDLDDVPFSSKGGLGRAHRLFGQRLGALLDELNSVLAA